MRCLLIQPRVCAEAAYPLGLASLIPGLQAAGIEVEGLDLRFVSLDEAVKRAQRAQLVGLTVASRGWRQAETFVRALHGLAAGRAVPVVLGGPLPSLDPVRCLQALGATAAVVGPGELVFPPLALALAQGERPALPGVYWRDGAEVVGKQAEIAIDLDRLPFADRRVFPLQAYSAGMRGVGWPHTPVVTSRGCLRRCPWCPGPGLHPAGFQARSPAHVYAELEHLAQTFGVRGVLIEDDDFFADLPRALELCALLRRRPLPLHWELVNGVPPARLEAAWLPDLAAAGCRSITLSLEVLHDHPLEGVSRASLAQVRALVAASGACGIALGGYFMVGLPGEAVFDSLSTVGRSLGLGLSRAAYSPFEPQPGSAWGGDSWPEASSSLSARRLAALGYAAFHLRPAVLASLVADAWRQPGLGRSLLSRAWELVR